MTRYPRVPELPASHPIDPSADPAPLGEVLYYADADSQMFVSPVTMRPPIAAQALPMVRLNAVTVFRVQLFSNGVPVAPDEGARALVRISTTDRDPVYESLAVLLPSGEYRITVDFANTPWQTDHGAGLIELSLDRRVVLADRCVIGRALWPFNLPAKAMSVAVTAVTDGVVTLGPEGTVHQLPPIPSSDSELHLSVIPYGGTTLNRLLFYSEADSLAVSVDGAAIDGSYTGPGWYCGYFKEDADGVIVMELDRLTDLDEGRQLTPRGFEVAIVPPGGWPVYGRTGIIYIDQASSFARIWKDGAWYSFNGQPGITPTIDPVTKHWIIGSTDTGIVAEAQEARIVTRTIQVADAVDDFLDDDADAETMHRIDVIGYVLHVSSYVDNSAPMPDRYNTKITYSTSGNTSSIWLNDGEYQFIMGLDEDRRVLRVDVVERTFIDGVPTDISDLTDNEGLLLNKTTTIDAEAPSDTKCPSERAVVEYLNGLLSQILST